MTEPDPLHEALIAAVERYGMWPPGATILVAVSGGQDSLALLHALLHLRERWQLKIHAAHFDHGLRGEESAADADAVAALARDWSVPFTLGSRDVAGAAKRLHSSVQETARNLRLNFLDQTAEKISADRIALGHTQDDRVESVLMNILRGAGIDGLRGMLPVSGDRVRPLIEVSRKETGDYCERHGLPVRVDPSNQSSKYTRNRIRHELLPMLEEEYNLSVRAALLRLAGLAEADSGFLQEEAGKWFDRAAANIEDGRVVLSLGTLQAAPLAMKRRVVRMALERVRGGIEGIEFGTIETVVGQLDREEQRSRFQLTVSPGDISIEIDGDNLVVRRLETPRSPLPVCVELTLDGVTEVPGWGLEVAVTRDAGTYSATGPECVLVDADAVKGRLVLRNRLPGDRLQPMGMSGTRKVQDILVDRKVPTMLRDQIPIVADEEGILWVAGHALAERARITPAATEAMRIEIRPRRESKD
jgi:tRNA(Ile)-lysidine synthase